MNKYVKLIKNISVFAIGTFTSKLLVFLLTPFYTRMLSPDDYGVVNIIVDTSNLILPIATICITDAVIRFGLDRAVDRREVFTNGLMVILSGFAVFLLFFPVLLQIPIISNYTVLIYLFVLCSSLNSICSQFVRARGMVKLFAYSGIQNTAIMVLTNILLLGVFRMGIYGYVFSIILADLISAIFLFWIAGLRHYLNFKRINRGLLRAMIVFSLPLIPTTLFWWVNTLSDKYIITYMLEDGLTVNGLYSAAHKLPTFITMIAGVVMQAWNISAVVEDNAKDKKLFYKNVFGSFAGLIFIGASFVILLTKVITKILVSGEYYDSWKFVPILMLAIVFNCFCSFLSSIYMVAKKNKVSMLTILAGAAVNVVLNLIMVPLWGGTGAAIATFLSCLLVFILRVITTKQFIRFDMQLPKLILNTVILIFQAVVLILEVKYWIALEIAFFAVSLFINSGMLINGTKRFLSMHKG